MPMEGRAGFFIICFGSLIVHCLLFAGVVALHDFELTKPKARVVQVDLVSFFSGPAGDPSDFPALPEPQPESTPNAHSASESAVPVSKKPAQAKENTKPRPVPTLKPDISLKSKPKNLKELMAVKEKPKKKELQKKEPVEKKPAEKLKPKPAPEKKLEQAREALAKKVEDQQQEQILQAFKRLQAAVAKQGGASQGQGTGSGNYGKDPMALYKMLLKSALEQNWVFNDTLAQMDQALEVRIMIKILKSGEIRDIVFETKSGNRYLDESAKKAIKRANPLPELPQGMKHYDVVVGFTPKGLK